jgi:hypothetical protein
LVLHLVESPPSDPVGLSSGWLGNYVMGLVLHTQVESLPYDPVVLEQRLAAGVVPELQAMHDSLAVRARELMQEITDLAAPEAEYPGGVSGTRDPCVSLQIGTKCPVVHAN